MKRKVTTKQILAIIKLMNNLKDFSDRKYGTIKNVIVMTNKMSPDKIYIKYEKDFTTGGEFDYEFRIVSVDMDGTLEFIDSKFKDIFERASFIAECMPFDIEDETKFEKID